MRSKLVVATATGAGLMFAAALAAAQEPNYTGSGWGPIAAQAANALTSGAMATRPYSASALGSYAYALGNAASTGYDAFAYEPGAVIAGSWNRRGLDAFAYAPAADLAVANYGLGMAAGAYCARRFKSYDANTGTFLGYDGQQHPCP